MIAAVSGSLIAAVGQIHTLGIGAEGGELPSDGRGHRGEMMEVAAFCRYCWEHNRDDPAFARNRSDADLFLQSLCIHTPASMNAIHPYDS